ncbi:MAG: hypothetical protein KDA96_12355, partial [Planctomycetaceae bacterium]|nr:hypothetical protein [Planctomycetaceae bacterium]
VANDIPATPEELLTVARGGRCIMPSRFFETVVEESEWSSEETEHLALCKRCAQFNERVMDLTASSVEATESAIDSKLPQSKVGRGIQAVDEIVRHVEARIPGYRCRRQRDTLLARNVLSRPSSLVAVLVALVLFCGAAGTAYRYADRFAEYEKLKVELGLDEPVKTGDFAVVGRTTLAMDARIDTRVVQRVVFRPKPTQEEVLYNREQRPTELTEIFFNVSLRHQYDVHESLHTEAEIEFVPFADVAQSFPEPLRRRTTMIDVISRLGLVTDLQQQVQFDMTNRLERRREGNELKGISFVDGWMAVLLRASESETTDWHLQNFGEPVELHAGQSFFVPCHLGDLRASSYEMAAIVVGSRNDLAVGMTQVQRLEQITPRGMQNEPFRETLRLEGPDGPVEGGFAPPQSVVQITHPEDGASIDGIYAEVKIITKVPEPGLPLVYVRPVAGGSKWYLQEEVEQADQPGEFVARIQVGDSNTISATRFQIVSVVVPDADRRAELSKILMRPELPEGFPRSEFLTITRQ